MTEFTTIEKYINSQAISSIQTDPKKIATYLPKVERYLDQKPADILADRGPFITSIKYLALLKGSPEAHARILEKVNQGLPPTLGAIASVQTSRRLGDYLYAPYYLEQLYYGFGESPYVGYFLAEAYAGAGNVESLEGFTQHALTGNLGSGSASQTDLRRWIDLLLDFALVESASQLLPQITDEKESSFLENRMKTFTGAGSVSVPIRSINLQSENRKWNIAQAAFSRAGYHSFERHEAVPGLALSAAARAKLVPDPSIRKLLGVGALACWLSHWKTWELIANDKHHSAGIVVEDDALPFCGPQYLQMLEPSFVGFDIVWLNRRMSGIAHSQAFKWEVALIDPWQQLLSWPESRQGWGADGYWLSAEGARKLLEMAERAGIQNHVDAQLGAVSTRSASEPSNRIQKIIDKIHTGLGNVPTLKSASLHVPVFSERPFGLSSTVTIDRD